ncbi:hypothetical protein HYPSUDRAFT_210317 [Hypholoma sublateritium FD-334 SS-4]|uniref:STB6-like N-terminal domain-containing protein n=1 Tax=Hypholoma sublateritium (strain FD-334 SS-4) TaxID=945553 RepID=A0A0D2N090_HYPSF|nr:hypothetical protein HYPSUDRAFT_210317 [Hypholoma sublateritium FD-334 SS-4]
MGGVVGRACAEQDMDGEWFFDDAGLHLPVGQGRTTPRATAFTLRAARRRRAAQTLSLLPASPVPPPKRFRRVRTAVILALYQLYAVERWITSRDRTPLLVVHTGVPEHSVVLDAYAPFDLAAWSSAITALRANGSRRKPTPQGTVMLTSFAHFRSYYTIVPIPGVEHLAMQQQLYATINLLRMGCSARSAFTLEDPGETTKDRFISSYLLPESTVHPTTATTGRHSSPRFSSFKVEPIQAALAIFGIYSIEFASVSHSLLVDGLLCDTTLAGNKIWTARIGAPCVGLLQPTDRIIDSSFVAALLSLVLATRNRLTSSRAIHSSARTHSPSH